MSGAWAQAFSMVLDPYNIVVMLGASLFGLFVGAMPGLTATMATALLVPVTFFMAPIPAIAAIVTATAMAIFAGDIPGCLLRMPGTPASAAYTDEAYAMTNKGQAELALGAGLVFSAIGGLFGTAVLMISAPTLAEFALKFSSFEYFWLVLMGLTCAVFLTSENPLKGFVSLVLGLLVASVGLNNPAGIPRFTFGSVELMGGIGLVPLMIGMFAISEIANMPIINGTRPMPPISSTLPKVKRGMPAGLLRPTLAIRRPRKSDTKPLRGCSDVRKTAQVNPISTSQKYSNELNFSANSASVGAAIISTAVPNKPPTAENTSPAPSATSPRPCFVMA